VVHASAANKAALLPLPQPPKSRLDAVPPRSGHWSRSPPRHPSTLPLLALLLALYGPLRLSLPSTLLIRTLSVHSLSLLCLFLLGAILVYGPHKTIRRNLCHCSSTVCLGVISVKPPDRLNQIHRLDLWRRNDAREPLSVGTPSLYHLGRRLFELRLARLQVRVSALGIAFILFFLELIVQGIMRMSIRSSIATIAFVRFALFLDRPNVHATKYHRPSFHRLGSRPYSPNVKRIGMAAQHIEHAADFRSTTAGTDFCYSSPCATASRPFLSSFPRHFFLCSANASASSSRRGASPQELLCSEISSAVSTLVSFRAD
jgi:hypothetical protein